MQRLARYLTPERAGWVMYRPAASPEIAADADAALALLTGERPAPLPPSPEVGEATRPASPPRLDLEREERDVRVYRTENRRPDPDPPPARRRRSCTSDSMR